MTTNISDDDLLSELEKMIKKKCHYLKNIQRRFGIETAFYGELINLGFHRNPEKVQKGKPDFKEFEVKCVTSNDLERRIKDGFTQHDKVIAIIAIPCADSKSNKDICSRMRKKNIEELKKIKKKYRVLIGNQIKCKKGNGFSNIWIPAICYKP